MQRSKLSAKISISPGVISRSPRLTEAIILHRPGWVYEEKVEQVRSRFDSLRGPDPAADALATPPLLMAFDLYFAGRDLSQLPQRERRLRLEVPMTMWTPEQPPRTIVAGNRYGVSVSAG